MCAPSGMFADGFVVPYRPSGNGIVERNHRTIKCMAERTRSSPLDMVFWYNMAPREGSDGPTAPSAVVSKYCGTRKRGPHQWRLVGLSCGWETRCA